VISEVDAGQLMKDAASTVVPHARKKGIQLVCEPGDLPRITCDREKVRQCLINLANNAVKFTPAGGTITVAAEPRGDKLALLVRDTGIGIAEENIRKIFETFYQVDGSSTREYGGAGLGLAIVKSFVDAHAGEVQVTSEPGKGSTFTLVLPLQAANVAGRPAMAAVPR
jgi:signal transduction histidine kinase